MDRCSCQGGSSRMMSPSGGAAMARARGLRRLAPHGLRGGRLAMRGRMSAPRGSGLVVVRRAAALARREALLEKRREVDDLGLARRARLRRLLHVARGLLL